MNQSFKKIAFLSTLLFAGIAGFAQRQLNEGVLTYGISITGSKAGVPAAGLNGATTKVYLKPGASRTDMTSSLGMESTVYNTRTGTGFILKEYSGQKLMITLNRENWNDKNAWNDQLKFTIESGTSTIAGYSCKKAVAQGTDGKQYTVYYTGDVALANSSYNNSFAQLPGLPVKYEVQSGDLTFVYTLQNVSFDPVSASIFDAPKSGFRTMTYEENQQLKKGK